MNTLTFPLDIGAALEIGAFTECLSSALFSRASDATLRSVESAVGAGDFAASGVAEGAAAGGGVARGELLAETGASDVGPVSTFSCGVPDPAPTDLLPLLGKHPVPFPIIISLNSFKKESYTCEHGRTHTDNRDEINHNKDENYGI